MEKEILTKSPGKTLIKVTDGSIPTTRKGFINLVNQGTKGEKTTPFKNISAVQLKKSSMSNGYIQPILLGGNESCGGISAATKDENTIMFTKKYWNEMEDLKRYIEEQQFTLDNNSKETQISNADEIKEYKELLDEGTINQEEFNFKKKELLGLQYSISKEKEDLLMGGMFGSTGIVLFIIGLVMLIVGFIKKTNKRTPMILLTIGIIFTTADFSLSSSNEANDSNKQESSSSDIQATTSNNSNKNLIQFEEFLEANNHDWGTFLDSYYSTIPATEQNTAFTKYISGKTYTFKGTVIESMITRIAIIANKEHDDKSWNDIFATPKVSYVISARDLNNADTFTKGDKVTFTGEISSRGSNIEKSYAQWDMINSKVSKK